MPAVLRIAAVLCVFGVLSPSADSASAPSPVDPTEISVPFTLDHNRMVVQLEFVLADGSIRTALAWVDTGSEYLTLGETLARDLGVDVSGMNAEHRTVEIPSPAPTVRLGGSPLLTDGVRTRVSFGERPWPGVAAEANLPASMLRHSHVIFDYPARCLTVATPGTLQPRGVPVPCRVNIETGLFKIEASIDGRTIPLGIDNGSAGTWVSDTLTTEWKTRHPDWSQAIGAAGSTNFFGFPFEVGGALIRLPEIGIDSLHARDVAALGLPQGLFEWYSKKSAGDVLGFLGANVLKDFRLEVDYPNRMTYWTAAPSAGPNDLEMVGLTLHPEADGGFTIAGVVTRHGGPVVESVRVGDRLIRVGDLRCAGATMGAVVDALRGTPGSAKTLVVEREGTPITFQATVLRLP